LPTREGYAFDGWSVKQGGSYFSVDSNSNILGYNLIASWRENAYTIIYDANGGILDYDYPRLIYLNIISDTLVIDLALDNTSKELSDSFFKKSDYVFKEWNTKPDGTGTSYSANQQITLNNVENSTLTLYAIWQEPTVQITYNANGGTGSMDEETVQIGVSKKLSSNTFERNGYIFKNWNTNVDGTGDTYTDGQTITLSKDLTLYAQWEKINSELNNYTKDENTIKGINLKTKLNDYISNFDYSNIYEIKVYKDDKLLTENDLISTGSIVKIYENDKLKEEYTNIVLGDVTGNGKTSIGDVAKLYQYFKGKITMDDCYKQAGDVVSNGSIKINDVAKLYQFVKGKINKLES